MRETQQLPDGWRISLLDEVTKRGSGHTPSKNHPEYWNGGIKWVSLTDSSSLDQGLIHETDKEISELGIANSSAVMHPAGTVVMSRDAGVGKSAVLGEEMAVSQHFIAWRCDGTGQLHNWFLYNWLQFHKREFERQAVGSTIKTIGLPYFKRLKIAYPPYGEQRRIAEILSTWDRAIESTEKLIANSEAQKKALMQQLLTGKKRLPGFKGDWQRIQLGDALSERVERNPGGLELLSVSQSQGVIPQEDAGRRNISSTDTSKYKVVRVGDIAYNTMRMWQGASALSSLNGIVSPAYTIVIPRSNQCSQFYSYLFKLSEIIHTFERHSQGLVSDTWNLKYPHLSKIWVNVPEFDEQQAIARVLNAYDQKLALEVQDLEYLRSEKHALMQQLIAGTRRVKVDEEDAVA